MSIREEYFCQSDKDKLLRYLLVKASPIMMKVKPAVLVRISNCSSVKEFQPYEAFCSHQKAILDVLSIRYLIMKNNGRDIQVLFYDRKLLDIALANREATIFLREHGYKNTCSTGECLQRLRSRFGKADFPHEIGIFLGYPLKDVRGFIEDSSSGTIVPQGRWRVFGDPSESIRTMCLFRFAENLGRQIIEHYQEITYCVEKLKSSVITDNIV